MRAEELAITSYVVREQDVSDVEQVLKLINGYDHDSPSGAGAECLICSSHLRADPLCAMRHIEPTARGSIRAAITLGS